MKKLIFFSIFVFLSCAQKAVFTTPNDSTDFFENGVYKQDIEVHFIKDGKSEAAEFKGILKKAPEEINLYAYVGFGIALFKVKDNLKDPIKFTTTEPQIEKNKDFFLKMYPVIKEIILLKKDDPRLQKENIIFYMRPDRFQVTVTFQEKNENGFPGVMLIENKNHFQFKITNREFESLRRE